MPHNITLIGDIWRKAIWLLFPIVISTDWLNLSIENNHFVIVLIVLSRLSWLFHSVGRHPSPLCSTLGVSLELHGPAWCILNSKTILLMNNAHYKMLFKSYSGPPVHLASMLHAIYLLEVLVTLGKLSRWCLPERSDTLACTYAHTLTNTQ